MLVSVARERGFKVLLAQTGAEGLKLARKHAPLAVTLDVFLPDMLGWTLLNQLKQDPETRHIPVQILTVEEERHYGLARGAFSFMTKPATTEHVVAALERIERFAKADVRELLIIEDDPTEQMSIGELIGSDDIRITNATTGAEGCRRCGQQTSTA